MPLSWTLSDALSFLLIFCHALSVHAAPNVPSHQKLATRQMIVANPFTIGPFAPASVVFITATSLAAFTQRVTTTVTNSDLPLGTSCILQGSGEGVDMVVLNSSPAATECGLAATSTSLPLPIEITFQFSSTGASGSFSLAPVVKASTDIEGSTTVISAETEDSTDNDDNDMEVVLSVQSLPTRIAVPQAVSPAPLENALESDLFFRPTDSISLSVGAFSGESTLSDFSASTQDWRKVTGQVLDINHEPAFSNLLVMRFLFSESTSDQPEMQNATFLLNGILTFKGNRPTGRTPAHVSWNSKLTLHDL